MANKVTRYPGKPIRRRGGSRLLVVGRFFPPKDGKLEHFQLRTSDGSLTSQLMKRFGDRFTSIGSSALQLRDIEGISLFEHPELIADLDNNLNRHRKLLNAVEKMAPDHLAELNAIVDSLPERARAADPNVKMHDEVRTQITALQERASALCRRTPALASALPVSGTAEQFAAVLEETGAVLFKDAEFNASEIVSRARDQFLLSQSNSVSRTEACRTETTNYGEAWATSSLLDQNAAGCLPEEVDVINCQNPESLVASHHSQLMDFVDSLDAPSVNILMANRILDLGSIHELESYFDIHTRVLGGVFAAFGGYGDLDELADIAARTPRVGTVGAGSIWVFVGNCVHRQIATSPIGMIVGRQFALDAYLQPGVRGAYGRITPIFGAQATKALRGVTSLDTEFLSRPKCVQLANAGLNPITRNRRGFLSAFSARTRSSLADYAQINPVRFQTSAIGDVKFYLEDEAIGDLNDSTIKRTLCDEGRQLVFGEFAGVPGLAANIAPGPSGEATEFASFVVLEWPDPIEHLSLNCSRNFQVSKA
jgi:hypothetical protein